MIAGFALLNQGLYETIGRGWYQVADEGREPIYADFLAYALTNLLGIVDVLDLPRSHHYARGPRSSARPRGRPPRCWRGFKVLLHPGVAGSALFLAAAEEITGGDDHRFLEPARADPRAARDALPQYGVMAIGPLLMSLRVAPSLTKEQRDQLPLILATIGPSIIPALVRHLNDPHEHVRAIVAAALGHLHVLETVPLLAALVRDPSDVVRQSVVEALGGLGVAGADLHAEPRGHPGPRRRGCGRVWWFVGWRSEASPRRPRTRSSWPWRPWSRPWATTRRRCGPRPPWRWAGSVRPPRRWPPG